MAAWFAMTRDDLTKTSRAARDARPTTPIRADGAHGRLVAALATAENGDDRARLRMARIVPFHPAILMR
jgi:hypothetical protein